MTKAETEYTAAQAEAIEMVEAIRGLLQDLPAPSDGRPINWAHVGTLSEVNARLAAVAAFLMGTEE